MRLHDGRYRKAMHRREHDSPVRFLTFSCYQRFPCFDRNWSRREFRDSLVSARARFGFRLIAWVIMPEHVHLVIERDPRIAPTSEILRGLKQPVAQRVLKRLRREGHAILTQLTTPAGECRLWQEGGGFDRNVRTSTELLDSINYVHWNPVVRGLVSNPTDWQWSSARWYDGVGENEPAIDRSLTVFG